MKRRGLLIVGQAPSRNTVGRPALAGKTGEHLARLFGFSRVNEFADAVNVLEHWPGKSGRNKGCLFPMREARERAELIVDLFPNYRCVIGSMISANEAIRILKEEGIEGENYSNDPFFKFLVVSFERKWKQRHGHPHHMWGGDFTFRFREYEMRHRLGG